MTAEIMTAPQHAPALLTGEQAGLVEALGATLTAEQARWASGYFAGLALGLARGGGAGALASPAPAAPRPAARTLAILYGSETGNGAELAKSLAAAATAQGLAPLLSDMADYKPRRLKDEQDLLIVVATHGEGDPPQPAADFFDFVESRKAPPLPDLRYAVLALGDMSYEQFCGAGKRIDARLEALGAQRLRPRVDCDVDFDEPAAEWSVDILALLAAEQAEAAPATPAAPAGAAPASAPDAGHDKRNPFPATVIEKIRLSGRGSSKETQHVELSLAGSGLSYQPGDALGFVARNDPAAVEALLAALDLPGSAPLTLKGKATTLEEALATSLEVTTATLRFLDHWGALTGTGDVFAAMDSGERAAFLHANHIVDIVRAFPLKGVDPQRFADGLRPLQPRLYSIASSLAACPDEAHITVAPVRYALHDQPRSGVASGQIADRVEIDSVVPVYIQANPHFRLPPEGRPIIMIGAGTGVAPYRAFLQEREARGGGRAWLFFGERHFRSDFLYQTEWQQWLADGTLTRMDVAFSRDGTQKLYVQHRLREQARDVHAWLEEGAHLYVCGDAARLAPDVHAALVALIAEQASVQTEDAEEYLRDLQRDGRYQRDIY